MPDVNPEGLMAIANNVAGEPTAYFKRAQATIRDVCPVPGDAWGALPGAMLGGPYEASRQLMQESANAGADATYRMAERLAHVAATYQAADNVNNVDFQGSQSPDLMSTQLPPPPEAVPDLPAGFYISLMVMFGGIIAAASGAAILTPAALGAPLAWMLVVPNDEQLGYSLAGWAATANDLDSTKRELEDALRNLDAAWVPGLENTSRASYDDWYGKFLTELDKQISAVQGIRDTFQETVNIVDTHQGIFLIAMIVILTILITLTIIELTGFGAAFATPMKLMFGASASVASILAVLDIGGVIAAFVTAMVQLSNDTDGMQLDSNSAAPTLPQFEELPEINW